MTEAKIKAEMRLWALECIVCQLYAILYKTLPPGFSELTFKAVIDGARKNTFPGVDPALSDLYSAELEVALTRLVMMQREYMAAADKPKRT